MWGSSSVPSSNTAQSTIIYRLICFPVSFVSHEWKNLHRSLSVSWNYFPPSPGTLEGPFSSILCRCQIWNQPRGLGLPCPATPEASVTRETPIRDLSPTPTGPVPKVCLSDSWLSGDPLKQTCQLSSFPDTWQTFLFLSLFQWPAQPPIPLSKPQSGSLNSAPTPLSHNHPVTKSGSLSP